MVLLENETVHKSHYFTFLVFRVFIIIIDKTDAGLNGLYIYIAVFKKCCCTQPTFCPVVNIWNSLSNYVVDVSTISQFKARLDKFWMHQDVLCDFTADLTGI